MPSAKRNSYRVARLVGQLPRVACFARNPGLGKRNSYRVAAACGRQTKSPSPALPKGRELLSAVFEAFRQEFFPLGKVGMGLLLVRFALAEGWNGAQKKQPSVIVITLGCFLVPRAGVEPARIAPLVSETSASTDSAIWATLSNNSDAKVRHFSELTNFFSEKRKNACAIRG